MHLRGNGIGLSLATLVVAVILSGCAKDEPRRLEGGRLGQVTTNNQAAPRRGHMAPDFLLRDTTNHSVRLSDFKGKAVLINFWATWCGPCLMEMPSLDTLYQRNRDKDFVVLAVAGDDEGNAAVRPFVKRFHLSFPTLLDPEMEVNDLYQVRTIPASFLVDRKGYIRDIVFGSVDWSAPDAQALIDTLLNL